MKRRKGKKKIERQEENRTLPGLLKCNRLTLHRVLFNLCVGKVRLESFLINNIGGARMPRTSSLKKEGGGGRNGYRAFKAS